MNLPLVDRIAKAVLYEGYILYPYRPSIKNQQRWSFGGIYPRSYSESQTGSDGWFMQAQVLVAGSANATLSLSVRMLHLTDRTVEAAQPDGGFAPVACLDIDGKSYCPWQEAIERTVEVGHTSLADLTASSHRHSFSFASGCAIEQLGAAGRLLRKRQSLEGAVEVSAEALQDGLYRVTARVTNDSPASPTDREAALLRSFVSTHMVLGITDGQFISLTDPPPQYLHQISDCKNIGCWPVLVGECGQTNTLLVSPIILPDYPQVAPESPGDLFDGCEIDEILTLRIMTLTDEEKKQAMAVDPRAAEMLSRTEALAREQLMNLHGAMRGVASIKKEPANG